MPRNQGWMARIASQETREDAREVFDEWLAMQGNHDAVTVVDRTGDVAAGEPNTPNVDNHVARNLVARYGGGRNPVRCIDVTGVSRGVVQVNMLLAELEERDPWEPSDD